MDSSVVGIVGQILEVDTASASTPKEIQSEATRHGFLPFSVDDGRSSDPNTRLLPYTLRAPDTPEETARLDVQHGLWAQSLGGRLYLSPLEIGKVNHVLDLGAGTGLWAASFALAHPFAQVLATDIATAPELPSVPSNYGFVTWDIESSWDDVTPLNGTFDFIHMRMLCYAIHGWQTLFTRCWNHLNPGGWLEIQDIVMPARCIEANVSPENSALLRAFNLTNDALRDRGLKSVDTAAGERFTEMLEDQGFVNVKRESIQWAHGDWPEGHLEKEIGRKHLKGVVLNAYEGLAQRMMKAVLGWDDDQVGEVVKDIIKDVLDPQRHFYHQLYVWTAQKPTSDTAQG